jgi:subtilisin family serine protease
VGASPVSVQYDPHLRQLLLEESEQLAGGQPRRVGVIARLADPQVQVPHLEVVARAGSIVTGRVDVASLVAVRQHFNVLSLKLARRYQPYQVSAHPAPVDGHSMPRTRAWTGRGSIIGMLDWGFDFAHVEFLDGPHTRFRWLWDQRGGATATSPQPYGYGREWDSAAINRALATPDPYATLGYDPAEIDRLAHGTHGTHTLGIACGNGRASGSRASAAPDASIIAVHLRGDDTHSSDTLGDSARILEAVDYVFKRAGSSSVVINMSLGRCGGPHDRSPLVVRGLDTLLAEAPGRAVVMSAGNYYASGQHASAQLRDGSAVEWGWQVDQPIGDVAELEIWYGGHDELTVELHDPGRTCVCRLAAGDEHVGREHGRVVLSAFHRRRDPNNDDNVVDLFLWPTATPGTWCVRLLPSHIVDGEVHGWIERVYRGQQSRFTSPDPLFTTNTICNGRRTLAVAAYNPRTVNRLPARFSSAGPARDLHPKPDLAAPGVGITAARSTVVVNGRRQRDRLTTMSGTSMAAPHVTAAVAVLFEAADRPLWAEEVHEILRDSARPSPTWPERMGSGLLDLDAALRRLDRGRRL